MAEQKPNFAHLAVNFCVGINILTITPLSFGIDPVSGMIYCEVTFDTAFGKGFVQDVFSTESFDRLLDSLSRMRQGEPASVSVPGCECFFVLEGNWNTEERVASFNATVGSLAEPRYCPREYLRTCIEMEFWMESPALEGPLAEVEALVEHIRALRSALPAVIEE